VETLDGEPLIYSEVTGDAGPWLVFVHGGFVESSNWNPQVSELCDEFRCLRLDLRGHGRSKDVPGPYDIPTWGADVSAVMHYHNVDRAVVIGHSMGVKVVVESFFAAAKESISGLVLVDGSLLGEGDPEAAKQTIQQEVDEIGIEAKVAGLFSSHFSDDFDPELKAEILANARGTAQSVGRELLGSLFYYGAGSFHTRVSELDVPVLVIATTTTSADGMNRRNLRDDETTTDYLEGIKALVPHAQSLVIPNSGHFVQYESPAALNSAISGFSRQARGE
jgi:pimeloyl-ACP methyl ester carboxylesterase